MEENVKAEGWDMSCDVLIIGAGLAGGTLARHLRLAHPDLDIVVVDRATEFTSGVDEPTSEEFADYANRVLRIGPYLRKHHVTSSGARFFFDSAERDLPIQRMSEIGGRAPHPVPTYLIDRPAVEQALCEMNRDSGVRVLLGTEVLHCQPGESPAAAITLDGENGHLVRTSAGTIRCTWLVDAAGEASPLVRMLDLSSPGKPDRLESAWARFRGCRPLDELGTPAWRRRVPHWGRGSSVSYFMYRGYWLWLLPVTDTECSIGVVLDRRSVRPSLATAEGFTEFLLSHRVMRDILGPRPEAHAFGRRDRLSHLASRQFSEDRWFLTGRSSALIDPMFGASSWIFTENNKLISEFIASDRTGRGHELPGMVHHYGIRIRSRFEKLHSAQDHYDARGSFDAWAAWLALRNRVYYNRIVPDAFEDHRILMWFARHHGTDCPCDERVMEGRLARLLRTADRLTDEFAGLLDASGDYHTGNTGRFLDSGSFDQDPVLIRKLHQPRDVDLEVPADERSYQILCRTLVRRLVEIAGEPWDEEVFRSVFDPDWDNRQTLTDMYQKMLRLVRRPHTGNGPDRPALRAPAQRA
ncbi:MULTISPECIES: FAD-dependent monooxygenase [unclassified Streptomyces]|uniref:FAD-dependent oxidoreductase n=1 Tax=unclassified Streptomyces TaxID=2593676 RepID=UPI0033AEEEC0